jgi:hypothetical protein
MTALTPLSALVTTGVGALMILVGLGRILLYTNVPQASKRAG